MDWDITSAYWARSFSLPPTARDKFSAAHDDWPATLLTSCKLRTAQDPFSVTQRQCVLLAFRKRAESYRSQLKGDALVESRLTPEQHAQIQQSLISLQLLRGEVDGQFGEETRAAIKRYQAQSGSDASEFLNAQQRYALLNQAAVADAPAPSPQPPTDTPRLKEGRTFLEDAQKFIASQSAVPSIAPIASEAANLQIALTKYDETAAVQSMKRLSDLLRPINGFDDFLKQKQAERDRDTARRLAEMSAEGAKNVYFIEHYIQENLGDVKTAFLINLRQQISASIKKQNTADVENANATVSSYVKDNGLTATYQRITKDFSSPPPPPAANNQKSLEERLGLTEQSKILVEGPVDDIVLLYNSSPTAPSIWKNVRGDIVFQQDRASLCFSHAAPAATLTRYVEQLLNQNGATKVTLDQKPCDLSKVSTSTDIIAFHRDELLKEREDYLLQLAKLIENSSFKKYQIVTDYASQMQNREALSLKLESEVEANTREGYGVLKIGTASTACVITPPQPEQVDGIKGALRRERDVIAPNIIADWQFIETTADLAFLGLQRHQCSYVAGNAPALHDLMLALRRDKIAYAFAPIWFESNEIAQLTFDLRDAREQELRRQYELERKRNEEKALDDERRKNSENQKSALEQKLRGQNGVRARALMNGIQEYVRSLAEKSSPGGDTFFSNYSKWLGARFNNQWQTFEVSSDVSDFGTVQWNGRTLDAIIVKTIIQQKNRVLGQYSRDCFMFGLVDDVEFSMQREPFSVNCDSGADFIKNWTVGKRFQSQWNVN